MLAMCSTKAVTVAYGKPMSWMMYWSARNPPAGHDKVLERYSPPQKIPIAMSLTMSMRRTWVFGSAILGRALDVSCFPRSYLKT